MKKISVISRRSPHSVMFILELAKLYNFKSESACILPDRAIQSHLSNYKIDLLEISGIHLYKEIGLVEDEDLAIVDGFLEDADYYLVLLEHDLFSINALKNELEEKPLITGDAVLLNGLDTKRDLNYILDYHFSELQIDKSHRHTIPIDEIDLEKQFDNQLAGKINIKGFSKEKQTVFLKLAANIFGWQSEAIKMLKKEIRKKV